MQVVVWARLRLAAQQTMPAGRAIKPLAGEAIARATQPVGKAQLAEVTVAVKTTEAAVAVAVQAAQAL